VAVLGEDRYDLVEPAVGCALGVADADLGILVSAPDHPIAADVIEQEEPGAERLVADFRVPHEEPASEAATGNLDPPILVRQEHEHIAIARVEGRVLPVDGDALAELARHAPFPSHPIAKAIDQHVDRIGVPDPTVIGSGGGSKGAGAAVGGCLVEQREETVEADGGTIKRGEIVGTHRVVLH